LNNILFKRGREFERGRSPLSPELPSPARDSDKKSEILMTGEGTQG
jgi:hypothetical protein